MHLRRDGHVFGNSPQASQGTVGPFGFRTENHWISTLDGITPYNLLSNPYPQGFLPPPGASQGLLTQAGANLQAPLQDTVTPWTMQWNSNIQRELPAHFLLEVAYVGTRGLQLAHGTESGMNINQLDLSGGFLPPGEAVGVLAAQRRYWATGWTTA